MATSYLIAEPLWGNRGGGGVFCDATKMDVFGEGGREGEGGDGR